MIIIGFFKNSKSYFAQIWARVKHWANARRALGVRFAKYVKFTYSSKGVKSIETRFRAIATVELMDGTVISHVCSSKGWPKYNAEETAPHTKFYRVTAVEGSQKSGTPRDYFVAPEGCSCPAYTNNRGLICGLCKHQLMLADELFSDVLPTPAPKKEEKVDSEKVDLDLLAKASINFVSRPKKANPGIIRLVEKDGVYAFYDLNEKAYKQTNVFFEQINEFAGHYESIGYKVEGLFHGKYWVFYQARGWVDFKEWQRDIAEARAMLGLGLR